MKYPVVTLTEAQSYVLERREENVSAGDFKSIDREGTGEDVFQRIQDALQDLEAAWKADKDGKRRSERDAFEGELSIAWHESLKDLPADVLTDRDFWRYLALRMFDFIVWRDGHGTTPPSPASFGAQSNNPGWDCVPLRMFNRALIAERGGEAVGDPDVYAGARVPGTDLWRSHILRVLNGYAPVLVHELLTDVKDGKWTRDPLRRYVKDLKRVRANLLFEVLDQEAARELLDTQRARTRASLDLEGADG